MNSFLYVAFLSNKFGASNKVQAVEMKALNGILGDKTQSAATSIAGGNVPGDVGLGGGVPGSVVPGDGTLSGSVHMAKE